MLKVCARPAILQVSLPYQVKRILNLFSFTVSFGVDGVGTPLECLGLRGYRYKLLAFMIAPISLALLIGSLAVGARVNMRHLSCRAILEAALPSFLQIMFFACAQHCCFERMPRSLDYTTSRPVLPL